MTAFFVSRIKVNDPTKMQEYAAATGPTIAAHGGKLVLRGASSATLIGDEAKQHMTSVVQFPDLDALNAWFNSPDYQQHARLRDEAGEMQFVSYQAPAA
ncbi:Uncharacterized conserved protein, DUF1330 family [Jannaschia faecimaris]|uniref:Uncharacterized conserved protein, DUF1330 family n=1 Tax=Jannaschia faecimaris TaxID=1244108 RepID=A0A1H3SPS1_9RHOB|nr:DUF1330 domain-containing protein [Jannaschia faecimaris]SDZ39996.1 Uncharacterized conserved protein, DUF1330 family [Jannaschia faecimaris]